MRHKGSLRRRIVKACVLLAAVLCVCFATIMFFSVKAIEERLVNARLVESADQLIDQHVQGLRQRVAGDPIIWRAGEIPADLRALPLGVHELVLDGRALHVLMHERAGQRYAVVDDESDYERIESDIWKALAGASVVCVLLAVALGGVTASRVIEPVVALSQEVQQNTLGPASASLAAADEVGVLARAFAERSDEMQRFLLREQLFTGDVSHELRTPLTIMLGAAELLQARLRDHPDLLPVVERIRRTAADTAERVGALLLLSRSPESFDAPLTELVPLVEQEIERCRPLLLGKPVELRLDVRYPAHVFARAELASIAIGNLIRNACQFTERGYVLVVVEVDRLTVEDSGVGVPDSVRARVFDRFIRAVPNDVPGTGLGLAIVRRVADHLGWTVVHESPDTGGSRFVITFGRVQGIEGEFTSP